MTAAEVLSRLSVRARTGLVAAAVVAAALAVGGLLLLVVLRQSLMDNLETTAEQRGEAVAAEIRRAGLPATLGESDDDELEDVIVQIAGPDGRAVRSSQPSAALPLTETDAVDLGGDYEYLVEVDTVDRDGEEYVVSVAVSREDLVDATGAVLPLLGIGLPMIAALVAGTTAWLTGRALRPVERIRREVEEISGSGLHRRVPEPAARDEIHRLSTTMNAMLARLEESADRQRRFVSDASHELRSPLASIRQAAEVSRQHPRALPEGELAETVAVESVRMQRLVEQLLLLTRADEGRLVSDAREVDLDDLVWPLARRSGTTRVTLGEVVPTRVLGDPIALGQVLRNLVDNAVRHAREEVRVELRRSGDRAVVVVEDDGDGVPVEDRHRIFDRFVRLDEARARDDGGSGLGLAIVRDLLAAHGGSVRVESGDPGLGGARFVVELPARPPA